MLYNNIERRIQNIERSILLLDTLNVSLEYNHKYMPRITNNKNMSLHTTTFLYMNKNRIHFNDMKSLNYDKIIFNRNLMKRLEKLHVICVKLLKSVIVE